MLFYVYECLPKCMSLPYMCAISKESRRDHWIPWDWSYRPLWVTTGVENCSQVLHKGTQCSFLLSNLSGPKRLSFSLNLFYNQDLIRNHIIWAVICGHCSLVGSFSRDQNKAKASWFLIRKHWQKSPCPCLWTYRCFSLPEPQCFCAGILYCPEHIV